MKFAKLRGKIREVFGTNAAFATAIGMDCGSLSLRLNDKAAWKREEMEAACIALGISITEVHLYFYA